MNSQTSTFSLRTTLESGDPTFGGWCIIPSAFSAEILAQRGFDWVALDWQHGFIDLEKSASMIQAISVGGAAPLVRVTFNEPWILMKALDLGAVGVIVPLVNNRAEAERAVGACRYPPAGMRSFGPVMNSARIGTDAAQATARVLCFVMIETADGYENIDEIARTPGLDGVFIGPDDLRLSTSGPEGALDPEAVARILASCRANGLVCGLHTPDGERAREAAEQGFGLIAIGSDADFVADSAARVMHDAHAGEPRERSVEATVQAVVWSGL